MCSFLNYVYLVSGYFVWPIVTNQVWTRLTTILELQISPYPDHRLILLANNYSQYLAPHLKSCGICQTVTMKKKRKLILIIQRVLMQICQKV